MNMIRNVLFSVFGLFLLCSPAAAGQQGGGFSGPADKQVAVGNQGGFSGPGPVAVSVEQAKTMRDDAHVLLRGSIVRSLGDDQYLFRDASGEIVVDIDHDKWGEQIVTPEDTVELRGEVDKDWNSVEIDVDSVRKSN